MDGSGNTSTLMVLSLYTNLRRSGASETEVRGKVRDLVNQLSSVDRLELIKSINAWETTFTMKAHQNAIDSSLNRATMVISQDAAQIYGTSEYDHDSSVNHETALRPVHRIVECPSCHKKNDASKSNCAYCGKALRQPDATSHLLDELQNRQAPDLTWFGPESTLVLTFADPPYPLALPVPNSVTFGRHTPESTAADIDLTPYRGAIYGVSRLHARITRNRNTLVLSDLSSTFHTFANDVELKNGATHLLKHGDRVRFGKLDVSVTFR